MDPLSNVHLTDLILTLLHRFLSKNVGLFYVYYLRPEDVLFAYRELDKQVQNLTYIFDRGTIVALEIEDEPLHNDLETFERSVVEILQLVKVNHLISALANHFVDFPVVSQDQEQEDVKYFKVEHVLDQMVVRVFGPNFAAAENILGQPIHV